MNVPSPTPYFDPPMVSIQLIACCGSLLPTNCAAVPDAGAGGARSKHNGGTRSGQPQDL